VGQRRGACLAEARSVATQLRSSEGGRAKAGPAREENFGPLMNPYPEDQNTKKTSNPAVLVTARRKDYKTQAASSPPMRAQPPETTLILAHLPQRRPARVAGS
jgi:hypothetical protein